MKNLKKKLLTMACVVGVMGLGYALPIKAFESKIPTDSPVMEMKTKEFVTYVNYGSTEIEVKYVESYKTLENGVKIIETDFGPDGKKDYITFKQELPDGTSITEIDKNADGDINYRATINPDGSSLIEIQMPDGSVKTIMIK